MTRALVLACVLSGCVGTTATDRYGSPTTVTSLADDGLHLSVHVFASKDRPIISLDDSATASFATVDRTYKSIDELPARAQAAISVGNLPVTFDPHGCITPSTIYERVIMTSFETHEGTDDITATIAYDCLDRDGTSRAIPATTVTIDLGAPAEFI